eukprot:scaffold58445_cov67-Phaeocystis_antarctica.AAC.2
MSAYGSLQAAGRPSSSRAYRTQRSLCSSSTTDGHEHLVRVRVTRLDYEDLGKGVTAMRVSRGAVQTNDDRRHLTLAAPRHLLPRAAVPDLLAYCHPRDHWRASSTLDGKLAAVGDHRAVYRGADAHHVLAWR